MMVIEVKMNYLCIFVLWLCCICRQINRITADDQQQSQELNDFGKYARHWYLLHFFFVSILWINSLECTLCAIRPIIVTICSFCWLSSTHYLNLYFNFICFWIAWLLCWLCISYVWRKYSHWMLMESISFHIWFCFFWSGVEWGFFLLLTTGCYFFRISSELLE